MKIGAIIAEYNPFHNGHRYQMEKFRRDQHLDYIIVIMSGNFTQRGEPAWMPKHLRTRAALMGGADLVLELPVYYATGSASLFAEGAIAHLNKLHCIDSLCFGCEIQENAAQKTDDIKDIEKLHRQKLEKAAAILVNEPPEFKRQLSDSLKKGLSYPAARAAALKGFIENPELLSMPNNILALEYMTALKRAHSDIQPILIQRKGEGYHSTNANEKFASASAIRKSLDNSLLPNGLESIPESTWTGIPEEVRPILASSFQKEFPVRLDDFSGMFAAAFLRSMDQLTTYPDISEDLANRMLRCFGHYQNLSSFLMEIKNKAYTYSRLCRCASHILLEQNKEILYQAKSEGYAFYARILGFQKSAAPLLSAIKSHSSIPLIGKMADYQKQLDGYGLELITADIRAADYYRTALQMKYGHEMKNEFNRGIIII